MDNDIIRIAEAMGWIRTKGHKVYDYLPFNPKTSHADCHALIEWLNERGFTITIEFLPSHVEIEIAYPNSVFCERGDGQNWKLLFCELTLKLLEKEGD